MGGITYDGPVDAVGYAPQSPIYNVGQDLAAETEHRTALKNLADRRRDLVGYDPELSRALGQGKTTALSDTNALTGYDPERMRAGLDQNKPYSYTDKDRSLYDDALSALNDALEDDISRIRSGSLPSGVTAAHQQAIADAMDLIQDLGANQAAATDLYDQYEDVMNPFVEEAIAAAATIPEIGLADLDDQMDERHRVIDMTYDEAEEIVNDTAELIDAGDHATAAALAEITGREMEHSMAEAEASEIAALIELEEVLYEKEAIARRARDFGQVNREEALLMIEFDDREEAANEQLEAAREAARRAAAARSAAIAQRNRAIAQAREEHAASWGDITRAAVGVWAQDALAGERPDRQGFVLDIVDDAINNGYPADTSVLVDEYPQLRGTQYLDMVKEAIDVFDDTGNEAWKASGGGGISEIPRPSGGSPNVK